MDGIYYVANDAVLDWFIASIKSLRAKGTTLPVRVIPYNQEISKLEKIAAKLGFEIWEPPELRELDKLAQEFAREPRGLGMFRKFACFFGPFENFAFLDADVVALMNWDELVTRFVGTEDDFWYFALSAGGVYQPGPLQEQLYKENRTAVFNAGVWVSRRGLFDLAGLQRLAEQASLVRDQFRSVGEQSFLNYCIDFSPVVSRPAFDRVPLLRPFNWANSQFMDYTDFYTLADRDGTWRGKRFSCIHWAGISLAPDMPYADLYLKYRLLGVNAAERAVFMYHWKRRNSGDNTYRK